MKIAVTLIVLALLIMGGVWAFKTFMDQPEEQPAQAVQQAAPGAAPGAAPEPAKPARSVANPGDQALSTANTPVAKSKIGRKINHIYSDHNKGMEKATGEE
jgi:hypothetical protein